MKYDFNNSQYAKFWDSRDAANALRIFLNDPDIIRNRHTFWQRQFSIDPKLTERQPDGTAVFNTIVRERAVNHMLDMRAPLGQTEPRDKAGLTAYQGTIPDFAAKGYVETAMEREARERMFEGMFGNDAEILSAFADDIQLMVDEGNQTMSNLAAQTLSKGNCSYIYGTGLYGNLYKNPIPDENFVTAGAKVWSDPTAKLIDQMMKIEQDYRERTGSTLALKWQIPRADFVTKFLSNNQVKDYIASFRTVNDLPSVSGMAITVDMFNQAFKNAELISPIELVEEAQRDGSVGVVHGWASGVAVLRPVGYAGLIKRASILDQQMYQKYGSSVIRKVFATRGLFTLVNSVLNNGEFKEWHTDLFAAAVPTLDEPLDHIIVDTTTADAGSGSGQG